MKLQVEGVSELVLEVQSMERAVSFWSGKLGFPIVDQWSYNNGQFEKGDSGNVWATWLYIGGNTRLGLWLPRIFSEEELGKFNKNDSFSSYIHVSLILLVKMQNHIESGNSIEIKAWSEMVVNR